MNLSVIVIDENELDCFIAQKVIQFTYKDSTLKTYQSALSALEDISKRENNVRIPTVILLDLLMPVMDGFQFVEAYEKLSPELIEKYRVYILSSTKNKSDITRILAFKTVKGIIEKPLTKEKMIELAGQL